MSPFDPMTTIFVAAQFIALFPSREFEWDSGRNKLRGDAKKSVRKNR
ncbi:hypothetical protein BH20CHL1_BH20CHL1_08020 [soil metagenome]